MSCMELNQYSAVCVCVRVTETDNVLTFIESFLNNSAHNDIVYQMCAIFLMIMCHRRLN